MLILILVALPIVFFMIVWVVVTISRIYFPEQPLPPEEDPIVLRNRARRTGPSLRVGAQEIREDQRRYGRWQISAPYEYAGGPSHQLPVVWVEDLERRRN